MIVKRFTLFWVSFFCMLGLFQIWTTNDHGQAFAAGWVATPLVDCVNLTRFDAQYFPATGKIYILGGRFDTATHGDIYAFDPVTQICSDTGEDLFIPVSNYTISLVNDGSADLLCIFGGRDSDGLVSNCVQCYNPLTNIVVPEKVYFCGN